MSSSKQVIESVLSKVVPFAAGVSLIRSILPSSNKNTEAKEETKAVTVVQEESATKNALYVVAGIAVGALAGVLLAPQKGEDLRNDITKKTKDVAKKTSEFAHELEDKGKEQVSKIRKEAEAKYEEVKQKATKLSEEAGQKVAETREKVLNGKS
ncbi:MAG: YtxH domain-containing protein [Bernardetiaceae bacterium]|nr:YtxH domain-containing protein [Bernardetiaceae bacterium]